MLLRRKPPHAGQWNGVGGKIETGETPRACILREVQEETAIDLRKADELRFGGIVTWPADDSVNGQGSGMYVYVAEFSDSSITWSGDRSVADGTLRWQHQNWVCDVANREVVANIRTFLPPMLRGEAPLEYFCAFQGDVLVGVQPRPLLQATNEHDSSNNEQHAQDTLGRHRHFR
ncbi:MAG TPA: NUDIX domain-containing protein [Chloroflexota bacterium]|jgi:8-oxo-dGTP diphosphatase